MGHNSTEFRFPDLTPSKVDVYAKDVVVHYTGPVSTPPEPPTRAEVSVFTAKSRRRLAFVASNTAVDFLSLLTLTYPREFPSDGRLVKKHLNYMLTCLRRRH